MFKRVAVLILLPLSGCEPDSKPSPFPHAKHVGENAISCVFCHPHAEKSAAAGLPSVKKCMDCHSFLKTRNPAMQPLFEAWETEQPLRFVKHNDLPDHLAFPHHMHVRAGLQCTECHGDVEHDRLNPPLTMRQCVACHEKREAARNCSACHK